MAYAAYKGSDCSGHSTYPGTTVIEGSSNVFINGRPAARVGDSAGTHCNTQPPYDCHSRSVAVGSSTVFINGRPAARVGDSLSCGGEITSGSSNVRIGG